MNIKKILLLNFILLLKSLFEKLKIFANIFKIYFKI